MSGAVSYGVLGPIELRQNNHLVAIGRRKERAVLALLLAAPNQTVSLDRMVDLLWGDEPPDQAISSLHAYISNLRRSLEPDRPPRAPATRLVTRPPGYLLVVEAGELDSLRFRSLTLQAADALADNDLDRAERVLTEALDLWRGPAYGEFADEPFALPEVARLDALRAGAVEDRLEVRLRQGLLAGVVADAEAIVTADPTRERAWGHLMIALYRSGRQADALRAYQRARTALGETVGIDPGPELQNLESRILAQDPGLDQPPAARPSTPIDISVNGDEPEARRPPNHLTDDELESRFVGRIDELKRLDDVLTETVADSGRVVLVSGEAGIGKTALVTEMTARAREAGVAVAGARWPETLDRPVLAPWFRILQTLGADETLIDTLRDAIDLDRAPTPGLLENLVDCVHRSAWQQPTLLVFDDIQWADQLSHDMLRRLAERTVSSRLTVVLIRRHPTVDEQPGLMETIGDLARLPGVIRLELNGLTEAETLAMIALDTRAEPAPEVVSVIHRETGGNAFYAVEMGRLLRAEGRLDGTDDNDPPLVPATVRDVLRQRLGRLPDQAAALLGVAAVFGPEVEPRLLQQVIGLDIDSVAEQLDLAEAAGFLQRHPSRVGRYRFTHELVRVAIEESMPALGAAGVHARAIEAIIDVHGPDNPRYVHRLARHARRSVDIIGPEAAIVHLDHSAMASRRMLNVDGTIRTLGQALDLIAEVPPGQERNRLESNLLMRLAQAELLTGGITARSEARFARALQVSRSSDLDNRIMVLAGYGSHSALWGAVGRAVAAGRELLEIGDGSDHTATIAGHYLTAFDALLHPDADAERGLATVLDLPGTQVGPSIRRAVLSLVDVADGRDDQGRQRANEVAEQTLASGEVDGWEMAWTMVVALLTLLLVGDLDAARSITLRLPPHGGGIAPIDRTIDGCRFWVAAGDGATDALGMLSEARRDVQAWGNSIFWIVMALAEAELLLTVDRPQAAALLAEAGGAIEREGLIAFERRRSSLLSRLGTTV